jgi:hypothetical protein
MPELTVRKLESEDTWKDMVQIPADSREDIQGNHISRGTICKIAANGHSRLVIVHGLKNATKVIAMDLNLRRALGVHIDTVCNFELRPVSWIGHLRFTWSASDPAYRVPGQLSLISFVLGSVLGVLGLILGGYLSMRKFTGRFSTIRQLNVRQVQVLAQQSIHRPQVAYPFGAHSRSSRAARRTDTPLRC